MRSFLLDIKEVYTAHKYELNEKNKCDYTAGRGAYGLVFCTDGGASYKFTDGRELRAEVGDVIFIGKDTSYKITLPKPFKHYTVNFDIHDETSILPMERDGYFKISPADTERYERAFKDLTKSRSLVGSELRDMSTIGKLYGIFGLIARDEAERTAESYEYRRLLPAKTYIEERYNEPITLEDLAIATNMSVTNFRREWKRIYKSTPLEYRDVLRIRHAEQMLGASFKPIEEIAVDCGFCSAGYFVRFFKKHKGMTPREFRHSLVIL